MVVFGCKISGTSKGYGEREISLATLKSERGTFSGLALLASQKWWFLVAKTVAPVRGMERGGHFFRACFACLSKVVVFGCKNSGTSKGYGEREISLATLEREGGTFSGLTLLASQKWWFLVAKRVAPVGG